MNIEYHTHYSGYLNRMMQLKRYGHAGKVVIVFPTSGGRFYEAEDFGLIGSASQFIEEGKLQFFCIDSVDGEGWLGYHHGLEHRLYITQMFENYLIDEFIPFVKYHSNRYDPFMALGCSMGAFHAVNFALRHPDVFDQTIALSGIYDIRFMVGDYGDHSYIHSNSPTDNLWTNNDPWFIDKYKQNDFIICVGQGDFEYDSIVDQRKLEAAFRFKGIDAWFDYWGYDIPHDWVSWRIQLPYFLEKLGY